MFAIYDKATGAWPGEVADSDAHDEATQGCRPVPVGWPDLYAWSAALPGFVPRNIVISRLAYQRLFTQAERIAIRASTDPVVLDFREMASLADAIDLSDPDVVDGAGYLVVLGLLTQSRADRILSGMSPE